MKNTLERLRQNNDLKADKVLASKRHQQHLEANYELRETILKAFKSLVSYMDNPSRITKTAVVNHLDSIKTPDALKVAQAVEELHKTVKNKKDVDLSEIASLLKSVLAQAEAIPKKLPDIAIPDTVKIGNQLDYSKKFDELKTALNQWQKEIKQSKPPVVNVDAPDMSPLQDVTQAVKDIDIPTPKSPFTEDGKEATASLKNGAQEVIQSNVLVTEPFDQIKLRYNDFDEEDALLQGVIYYFKRKKVAEVSLTYNEDGMLTGVKKQ